MPLYDLQCAQGHRFERYIKLAHFDDPQACDCGASAARMLSAPRVISDYIEPCMGMDGKMHDSLASYRKTLLPEGNPRGERYTEIGNERVKADVADERAEKAARVQEIKRAIHDVRSGNMPTPTVSPVAD